MIRYIFVFCLSFSVLTAYAQDSLSLQQRVKILEQYNHEVLNERFEAKSESLKSEIDSQITAAKTEINEKLSWIKIVGTVCGIILAAGILTLVYQFFFGLKKLAEQKIKEKLDTHLADNTNYIIDVISSQRTETLIKNSKKVLIICGQEEDKDDAIRLLKSMHFKKIETTVLKFYEKLPSADLYVLNNQTGKLHQELVIEFLEKSESDDSFVYYGGPLQYDRNASYADQLNFANTKYTLYHQIINMLSFKEVMKTKYHE